MYNISAARQTITKNEGRHKIKRTIPLTTLEAVLDHLEGQESAQAREILRTYKVEYANAATGHLLTDGAPTHAASPGLVRPFTAKNGRTFRNSYYLVER